MVETALDHFSPAGVTEGRHRRVDIGAFGMLNVT
jgi:hypothetical protein